MEKLKTLLFNRNVIFLLALAGGLLFPFAVPVTRYFILPTLALTMTISTMEIDNDVFRSPRSILLPALIGISMSYAVLGSIMIGLSTLLIRDEDLRTGFILVAAVPPAIAVVPFTGLLRGNHPLSLFGTVGAHLGGLAIIPLVLAGFLGASSFDPYKMLMTLLMLIVLPLVVSRLLIRKGIKGRVTPYRGIITNWGFFVILYTMVGLNRDLLLGGKSIVFIIAAILVSTSFILGFLIDRIGGLFRLPRETRTSLVLLGTLKNQANAGGLALTFFSQEAALPAAVSSIVMITYFVWLDFRKRWD